MCRLFVFPSNLVWECCKVILMSDEKIPKKTGGNRAVGDIKKTSRTPAHRAADQDDAMEADCLPPLPPVMQGLPSAHDHLAPPALACLMERKKRGVGKAQERRVTRLPLVHRRRILRPRAPIKTTVALTPLWKNSRTMGSCCLCFTRAHDGAELFWRDGLLVCKVQTQTIDKQFPREHGHPRNAVS